MNLIIKILLIWAIPLVALMAFGMSVGQTTYWECLKGTWEQWWEK